MLRTETFFKRVKGASANIAKNNADGGQHECCSRTVLDGATPDGDRFEDLGLRKLWIADRHAITPYFQDDSELYAAAFMISELKFL